MSEYSDKSGNVSISLEILQKTRDCDKIILHAAQTSNKGEIHLCEYSFYDFNSIIH